MSEEAYDQGGKRVSKDVATYSTAPTHGPTCEDVATCSTAPTHGPTCVIGHSSPCWHDPQWTGPLPSERARNQIIVDRLANAAQLEPSNDPPLDAGCAICGGVDPMYGGTMSCPHCDQNLCPVCFPPTQHEPCCSSLPSSLEMILSDATAISSQYPFHFDICGGKVCQTTTVGLDESMARACKRDGVAKRGTFSHRGRGKGSGGSGGGGARWWW